MRKKDNRFEVFRQVFIVENKEVFPLASLLWGREGVFIIGRDVFYSWIIPGCRGQGATSSRLWFGFLLFLGLMGLTPSAYSCFLTISAVLPGF